MKFLLEPLRLWWQKRTGEYDTPFDGDGPAWIVSMVVHVALLVILTAIGLTIVRDRTLLTLSTDAPEKIEEPELIQEVYFSDQPTEQIGANSVSGEQAALAMAAVKSDISDVVTPEIESEVGNLVVESPTTISVGPNVSADMVVRGSASGVGTTGAMGAVDRITHEILLSLEQRKTLVVWVFDKSGSLQRQRNAVVERFDKIYEELGVIEAAGNKAFAKHDSKPLLTSVMAFGQDVQPLTKEPTDDLQTIKDAVNSIQNDESGVERVFSSVYEAAKKTLTYRMQEPRRNVMIVVFTDEAGDDQEGLDPTVNFLRRYQIPVYIVGVPAPFGRKMVDIKYVDPNPEYDQTAQWIPVHQGPETQRPERVKLYFTGAAGQDEAIDSGFGPYALTRLCYETGGIYFAVHPNRAINRTVGRGETAELSAHFTHFFDPNVMRRYAPDYVTQKEYEQLLMSNKARYALVQASELSWAAPMSETRLVFPKADEASFVNIVTNAQREAAKVEPRLDAIQQILAQGEKDRLKLEQPRWQVGYDLAMGRTLAVSARTKAYNAMLAQAKQGLKFKNEKNDTWVLNPSDKMLAGSVLEKQAQAAKVYLTRVVDEHPGTPWAMLAARELSTPIGWEWQETYTGVNAPRMGDGGGGNPRPNDDKMRMMKKPLPKRTPKL